VAGAPTSGTTTPIRICTIKTFVCAIAENFAHVWPYESVSFSNYILDIRPCEFFHIQSVKVLAVPFEILIIDADLILDFII
jgi:hypothetical protein